MCPSCLNSLPLLSVFFLFILIFFHSFLSFPPSLPSCLPINKRKKKILEKTAVAGTGPVITMAGNFCTSRVSHFLITAIRGCMAPRRKNTYIDVFMYWNDNICPCENMCDSFLPRHMAYYYS